MDATEVTAFCLGAIFDFHNLLHLKVKHEGGETIAADLLGLSEELKRDLAKERLGPFLERNDEKRISVLEPKAKKIWNMLRAEVEAVLKTVSILGL